jgi:hypothetical protein
MSDLGNDSMKPGSLSVYSPPRVVRIGDLIEGAGVVCAAGATAVGNCTSVGHVATGAGSFCTAGDNAADYCSAGTAAVTGYCTSSGSVASGGGCTTNGGTAHAACSPGGSTPNV